MIRFYDIEKQMYLELYFFVVFTFFLSLSYTLFLYMTSDSEEVPSSVSSRAGVPGSVRTRSQRKRDRKIEEKETETEQDFEAKKKRTGGKSKRSPKQLRTLHSIPLIFVRNGKLQLNEEAKSKIMSCQDPICVVAMTGKMRTGKSYLLSQGVLGDPKCFKVSDQAGSCTRGIFMHGEPLDAAEFFERIGCKEPYQKSRMADKKLKVIVLDVEGKDSFDRGNKNDNDILTLCFLITSLLIFNSTKTLDQANIDTVASIVQATESLCNANKSDLRRPNFLWVVRDFHLNLGGMNDNEYLDHALESTYVNEEGQRTRVDKEMVRQRNMIKRFFKKRGCCTLVSPDLNKLAGLENYDLEDLSEPFQRDIQKFRRVLPFAMEPLQAMGSQVTGPILVRLLDQYMHAINSNKVPRIRSAWLQMTEDLVSQYRDKALNSMKELVKHASTYSSITSLVASSLHIKNTFENQIREQDEDGELVGDLKDKVISELNKMESEAMDNWLRSIIQQAPPLPSLEEEDVEKGEAVVGKEGDSKKDIERNKIRTVLESWMSRSESSQELYLNSYQDSGPAIQNIIRTVIRGSQWSRIKESLSGGEFGTSPVLSAGPSGPNPDEVEAQVREQTQRYQDQLNTMQKDYESYVQHYTDLEQKLEHKTRDFNELQTVLDETKESMQQLRKEVEEAEEAKNRVKFAEEERDTLTKSLKSSREEIHRLNDEIQDIEDQMETQSNTYKQQIQRITDEATQKEKDLKEKIHQKENELKTLENTLSQENRALQQRCTLLEGEIKRGEDSAKREWDRFSKQVENLQNSLQSISNERDSVNEKYQNIQLEQARLEARVRAGESEIDRLKTELEGKAAIRSEKETLETTLVRERGQRAALEQERGRFRDQIKELDEKIISLHAELRDARKKNSRK